MAYTTIDDPELYFQTVIYTGDGNTGRSITLDGSEDMQPNLVWVKNRTDEVWHVWSDSIAGAGAANDLATNSDEAAGGGNKASYGFLSAFGSDGFTVSEGSSNASMSNQSSKNYVAWCWKESATAGFDIVSYTGNGSARTISHNLSAVPDWMVVKDREANNRDWQVYAGDETDALALNNTDATGDSDVYWNDTAPTSSVFSVKFGATNTDGEEHIAYIFTSVQGYSKMGFYHGNGNVDGTFIYLGFRPAWFMIKRTNASEQWEVVDNKDLFLMTGANGLTDVGHGILWCTEFVKADIGGKGYRSYMTSPRNSIWTSGIDDDVGWANSQITARQRYHVRTNSIETYFGSQDEAVPFYLQNDKLRF